VEEQRRRAVALLARPPETLTDGGKNTLRTLAVSIEELGHIQREQGKPECIDNYKDCIPLYQCIGDQHAEAVLVFNIGHTYKELPVLRDLDEAERWYQRSLELLEVSDRIMRGRCIGQLGFVALERSKDAKKAGKTQEEIVRHLNTAADYY
jgi:hypothetical protein